MSAKQKKSRGFAVFITILVILLILAVALFIYGSTTNGIIQPRLPRSDRFALGAMQCHG